MERIHVHVDKHTFSQFSLWFLIFYRRLSLGNAWEGTNLAPDQTGIHYTDFVALREIYQNVCPEFPENPRDIIFPRRQRQRYISLKQWNNCYVTMLEKSIQNSGANLTPADPWDLVCSDVRTVKCPSLVQSCALIEISGDNIMIPLPAVQGKYNVTHYLGR